MERRLLGALLIVVLACSSISITTFVISGEKNVAQDDSLGNDGSYTTNVIDDTDITEEEVLYPTGYYADIGKIYVALTDDDISIKLLRYHAPGKDFNYGTQPVLLFPGIMANANEFLMKSTPELTTRYNITLPNEIADWAKGDENLEKDPMLYYSIAYYLWKMGFDPWFANYRGIGYGAMKSEDGDGVNSIDEFGLYDVRASVRKVYEITKLHPVVGGHSTGGLSSIMYLEGCKFGEDGHVVSDESLVKERNGITEGPETVKGFIGLDPAWIPGMSTILNNYLTWLLLYQDSTIDYRNLLETLLGIPSIADLIDAIDNYILENFGETMKDLLMNIVNLNYSNVNQEWLYSMFAYAIDKIYSRTLAEYLDNTINDMVRESFRNGEGNEGLVTPPEPSESDGYYYYSKNVYKMSVPEFFINALMDNDYMDLVDAEKDVRDIVNGKTKTNIDEYYIVNGAHIDVVAGISAPIVLYPKLRDRKSVV